MDDAYVSRVRQRVPELATFTTDELARDGRQGACIDVSAIALRFLEAEGIWGCQPVGSVSSAAVRDCDLSIQAQLGFTPDEMDRMRPVLAEMPQFEDVLDLGEIAEPEERARISRAMRRKARLADVARPALRKLWQRHWPEIILTPGTKLKYIECGMTAGEGIPLAEMANQILSGQSPDAQHREFLRRFPR